MNINEKLAEFAKISENEAQAKRKALYADIEHKVQQGLKKQTDLASVEAAEKINSQKAECDQLNSKRYMEAYAEQKNEAINKRQELTNRVFENVLKKLTLFTNSDSYRHYINEQLKDCTGYGSLKIEIMEKDKSLFQEALLNFPEEVELVTKANDIIGGFIAYAKGSNRILNNSFRDKLEEAKEGFNEYLVNFK